MQLMENKQLLLKEYSVIFVPKFSEHAKQMAWGQTGSTMPHMVVDIAVMTKSRLCNILAEY